MSRYPKKAMPEEPKFSDREKRVFSLFWKVGFNVDVPIDKMYNKYNGAPTLVDKSTGIHVRVVTTSRHKQMSMGMVVTRINRKLRGTKIVPGALKRTYRITQLG